MSSRPITETHGITAEAAAAWGLDESEDKALGALFESIADDLSETIKDVSDSAKDFVRSPDARLATTLMAIVDTCEGIAPKLSPAALALYVSVLENSARKLGRLPGSPQ